MAEPSGSLTAAQFEILEAVWDGGGGGATVAEIWQRICARRSVARTTVLNQVDRLLERGWLLQQSGEGGFRYLPALSRDEAAKRLADEFVEDFFAGSASGLVSSLLGGGKLPLDEVRKLRRLLDEADAAPKTPGKPVSPAAAKPKGDAR